MSGIMEHTVADQKKRKPDTSRLTALCDHIIKEETAVPRCGKLQHTSLQVAARLSRICVHVQ